MLFFKSGLLAFALGAIGVVNAHGVVSSPSRRRPGPALAAVCGQQVFNNINGDEYGTQQGAEQNRNAQTTAACKLYLCKGLQFSDNAANVQHYTVGQVVPITIDLRAPHTGVANVSVVKTTTNSLIGAPLISFTDAYSNSHPIPPEQTSFSVTVPNLSGQCAAAGDCVLQWWWDARPIDQTYMSCVDFTQ